MNVQQFLRDHAVEFDALEHPPAYDAQRMAQSVHTPGREVAKTVLLRAGDEGQYIVALLPANLHVDLGKVRQAVGAKMVELATEAEIGAHCSDCEIGALPPFGSQYDMQAVVDERLTEDETIVFEGNTHQESIRMKYTDFAKIEKPLVASFSH